MGSNFKLKRVVQVNIGDIVYYEEDVFIMENKKPVFFGVRCTVVKVEKSLSPGQVLLKVIKSAGANAEPCGAQITRSVDNLLCGYDLNDMVFDSDKMKSGGHLEGVQNGKPIELDTAKQGGMSVGASHEEDGIKGVVGGEKRPIEFEGEEIILTAPVASNTDKYDFEGQQLTGREIASKLNVDNGGVSFAEGGQPGKCRCSGKKYNFGGQTIADADILKYINFMSNNIQDRIIYLK
jgi:hypothetical protein